MSRFVSEVVHLADLITNMSYETAITIMLTALGVMLAILAIGMAVLAIWGYVGFKDFVREAAKVHVAEAMTAKMKEYPGGADVLDLMKQLKNRADILEGLQNQIVTPAVSKPVASAASGGLQVTPIAKYPGEEERQDANNATSPPAVNSGPSNREVPEKGAG